MRYKLANIVRYLGILTGLILSGISMIIYHSEYNVLFAIGIVIVALSILVGIIFYRCPKCGHMLAWKPLNLKYCQNCGNKL